MAVLCALRFAYVNVQDFSPRFLCRHFCKRCLRKAADLSAFITQIVSVQHKRICCWRYQISSSSLYTPCDSTLLGYCRGFIDIAFVINLVEICEMVQNTDNTQRGDIISCFLSFNGKGSLTSPFLYVCANKNDITASDMGKDQGLTIQFRHAGVLYLHIYLYLKYGVRYM